MLTEKLICVSFYLRSNVDAIKPDNGVNIMARNITKTVSAKKIVGNVWKLLPKNDKGEYIEGQKIDLFEIRGEITGTEMVVSQFGENTGFVGNFEAFSNIDGEITTGVKCFLPNAVTEMLASAFEHGDGERLLFALAIGVKYANSAKGPGYEYTITELMENKSVNNVLADLTAPFSGKTLKGSGQPILAIDNAPASETVSAPESEDAADAEVAKSQKTGKKG